MPRYTQISNSFTAGQLSQKLDARTDIEEYRNGLKELTNMFTYRSGGAGRRPGFDGFGYLPATSSTQHKSIPVSYGSDEHKIIHIDLQQVIPTNMFALNNLDGTVSGITNVSGKAHSILQSMPDAVGITHIQLDDIVIICHSAGVEPIIIARTSRVTSPLFQVVAWTESEQVVSSADSALSLGPAFSMPMRDPNVSTTTITPSAAAGAITLTASTAIFDPGMVGSYFMLEDGSERTIVVSITGYSSTTSINGTVIVAASGYVVGATDYWYEAAWSDYRGWPRIVSTHESRTIFGGSAAAPSKIWASEQFVYFQMNRYLKKNGGSILNYNRAPALTQNAFEASIASASSDYITWISSGINMLVGTASNEYVVTSGDTSLSALSVGFRKQTSHGGHVASAVTADNAVYFISKDKKSIIELNFSRDNGAYVSRNLSILSDEILYEKSSLGRTNRYEKLAWQESRSTLWALRSDGQVVGITLNRSANVVAFSIHPMPAVVRDIYVQYIDDYSEIFISANLDDAIAAPSQIFIASMGDDFEGDITALTGTNDPIYFDFAKEETAGLPATVFTTIWEEGTVVDALHSDGTIEQGLVVDSSNQITLAVAEATRLRYGLPYKSRMVTLRPEVGPNPNFNSQGDITRIDQATLLLYKTYFASYGSEDTDLYDVEDIVQTVGMTDRVQVDLPQNPDTDNRVVLESSYPLPMNILGIIMRGVNNQ